MFKKPTIPGTPMGEVAPILERDTAKDYTVAVVLEFPSLEKALAWNSGPEYTKARAIRKASSTGPFMITENLDETGFSFNALIMLAVKINDPVRFAGEYLPGFAKCLNQDGEQLGALIARGLVKDHPKMGPAAPFVEDVSATFSLEHEIIRPAAAHATGELFSTHAHAIAFTYRRTCTPQSLSSA